jgi:hypothetical protein
MIEGDGGFSLGQLCVAGSRREIHDRSKGAIYEPQIFRSSSSSGIGSHRSVRSRGLYRPENFSAFQKMSPLMLQRLTADSRSEHENAAENIVGTWHVIYTAGGSAFGEAFIQWHNDGTEWENIDFPILGGNICMGSWKPIDKNRVTRNHIGWLYTNGVLTGYFTETETDLVAHDGNSYHGINDQKVFDLEGNMVVEVPGTSTATRIAP